MKHDIVSPLLAIKKPDCEIKPIRIQFVSWVVLVKGALVRTFFKFAAVATCIFAAPAALAAPTIVSAALTGPTGTVWNTKVDNYYTLFIERGVTYYNPSDNFSGAPVTNPVAGDYDYEIKGDGFPTGVFSNRPSDLSYTLTLILTEGSKTGTLSGVFTEPTSLYDTGTFTSTSSPLLFSSGNYSLTQFTWYRQASNLVGAFSATNTTPIGPGSRADYLGGFTITSTAVPEPATWALMILGFGAIGGALRARRNRKPSTALA